MNTQELTILRLNREQSELIGIIGVLLEDVCTLLRYMCDDEIKQSDKISILNHHIQCIHVLQDIVEGK
jgi:hypothetical protein